MSVITLLLWGAFVTLLILKEAALVASLTWTQVWLPIYIWGGLTVIQLIVATIIWLVASSHLKD